MALCKNMQTLDKSMWTLQFRWWLAERPVMKIKVFEYYKKIDVRHCSNSRRKESPKDECLNTNLALLHRWRSAEQMVCMKPSYESKEDSNLQNRREQLLNCYFERERSKQLCTNTSVSTWKGAQTKAGPFSKNDFWNSVVLCDKWHLAVYRQIYCIILTDLNTAVDET